MKSSDRPQTHRDGPVIMLGLLLLLLGTACLLAVLRGGG